MGMQRVFAVFVALLLTNPLFAATSNIGATPGSFNVSPSGAANYTIPITVPPGVNGMQPGLVFSYNSQGGNGLLGMGWNFGSLSTLHRCPATYEQDGYKGGVNLDTNDRLCLDGQRLIPLNGSTYWSATEYRTEIESFTKIISYGTQGGGPAYFRAWNKTGQIIEFGVTADARIEAQGKSVVLAWPVNKIQDTSGNYLTVSYTENNAAGEYYPARIDYTGNLTTGLAPTRSVQFVYATRPDVETAYTNGSRSQTAQRLTGVRTFVGAGLVRDYRLAYDISAATARSRLVSVQECAGDGVCLGATQLGWQYNTTGSFRRVLTDTSGAGLWPTNAGNQNLMADINGDGKLDHIWIGSQGTYVDLAEGTAPDLLTTLTTPLGIQVKDITYKPLTDASVYTKENTAAYPLLDLQVPVYVVASYAINNGISGFNTTRHTYAGAKVHQTGRGYLGFRVVTETAPNGIKSTTTYRQDYPYIGLPAQVDVQQPNGGLLSRTLTNWQAINYGGGRYFPYALSTTASSYELNGALITSATTANDTLDSHGNIGRTTVTHSDNHKKVVLTSYDNDTVNWRLGRPVSAQVISTLPNGQSQTRTSSFSYHASTGLLIKDIIEPGTALALTTDTVYDAYGHKASVTVSGPDIVTRTPTFAYLTSPGEAFAQTRSTNALGHSETQVLDARFGVPVSLSGPNGLTTMWAYDGFGRKLQETRADGTITVLSYTACPAACPAMGRYAITSASTGNAATSVYYDSVGRAVRRHSVGFSGAAVYEDTLYDTLGRAQSTSRPYLSGNSIAWATFTYDLLNRPLTQKAADGGITSSNYQGLSTRVTNAKNQSTTQIKNSQGQLVQAIDAAGNSTTYGYDPLGNLVKVVDAKSNILTMGYDLRGRKTSMVDPDMGSWIYQYNALGELTYQLDAKSQAVTMQYDVLGRLIKRTEPEGISQWSYDTVANGKGKPATVTGPGGYARSYVYDGLGRPVRVSTTINATTYLMDTGYDAVGRVASTAYPTANDARFTVYTQYNATGYLAAVTNSAGFVYWQANARDAEGHLVQETLGNGLVTTRSYNIASGAINAIRTGATNNVQNLNYAFDYLGNLQSRNDAIQGITETFGYDILNRLTGVSGLAPKTYAYDSIGNITSKSDVGTYSYGAKPHAVTSTAGAVNSGYTYDVNGNMIESKGRTLAYTSFNLPSSITKGGVTTTFTYDADRARTVQTTASETTVYLNPRWDLGGHYEKETKSSGVVEHKHYIYGSSGPVAIYTLKGDGSSTTRYLHKDHLGSVVTVTSETGAVLERYSYDAFGKRRLPNGTDGAVMPATTHHGYTGHEHLDDIDLIHMNGRVYDPALGRFAQADSIVQDPANSQSLNRYSYVVNNPFAYTDPTGHYFCTNFDAVCGGSNQGYGFGGTSGTTTTATTTGGGVITSTTNGKPNGATSSSSVPVGNTTTGANPLPAAFVSSTTGTPGISGEQSISRALGLGVAAPGVVTIGARLLSAAAPAVLPGPGWVLGAIGVGYTGWEIYNELTRPIEGADDPGRMMYHYTSALLIGALWEKSFITPLGFLSATNAIELLALPERNRATLMYTFVVYPGQYERSPNSLPGTNIVAPANGHGGGGIEFWNTVPLTPQPHIYYTTP